MLSSATLLQYMRGLSVHSSEHGSEGHARAGEKVPKNLPKIIALYVSMLAKDDDYRSPTRYCTLLDLAVVLQYNRKRVCLLVSARVLTLQRSEFGGTLLRTPVDNTNDRICLLRSVLERSPAFQKNRIEHVSASPQDGQQHI